jgi:putative glutamine amidotransferase
MVPIIGVTSSLKDERLITVADDNIYAIEQAGGIPVILPNLSPPESIDYIAQKIDGLLLTGGGDIDPTLFGEEPHKNLGSITPSRDEFEIHIIRKMLEQNKPILGICRGCQILNIAAGGDMYQDIYTQHDYELLQHSQRAPRSHTSHFVKISDHSLLAKMTESERFKVNSFHHQAVRNLGHGFKGSAVSSDGIIEAFESVQHSFVLGVQWHPECTVRDHDHPSEKIFKSFIEACTKVKAMY